jgi:hypothetical protein
MIYEYVRDRNGHPLGVVVALGKKEVGWSLCNKKDRFDRDFALKIASGRAMHSNIKRNKIPKKILPTLDKMEDRAKRYYKNKIGA